MAPIFEDGEEISPEDFKEQQERLNARVRRKQREARKAAREASEDEVMKLHRALYGNTDEVDEDDGLVI